MDKYIGKVLDGRYEILEEVGNGGMAVVYKAKDFDTGSIVAVKILREEYLDNEEFCRRFRNESRAIALLNHPNIVKIFDVCNSPSLQYIVMEYIDGISLKDYIEQQRVVRVKEPKCFPRSFVRWTGAKAPRPFTTGYADCPRGRWRRRCWKAKKSSSTAAQFPQWTFPEQNAARSFPLIRSR